MGERKPKYQFTGYSREAELYDALKTYREESTHHSHSSVIITALEEKLEREGYYND